ncbi:MAG: hypothetical protein AB7V62_15015, partial [Thermoleophilia bacterium]
MARSFYKGENLGSIPACAICVGKGRGKRAELHLPCGVSVWLCEAHRDPAFLTSRAGRDLIVSLMHVWRATGCMTAARSRALDIHGRRLRTPAARERPGSYSWPALRSAAEEGFARGERPSEVIRRIRGSAHPGDGRIPSVRTMQRWFRECAGSARRRPVPPGGPPGRRQGPAIGLAARVTETSRSCPPRR